eukprot:5051564-Prymnesium_polylepis.1
MLAQVPRRVPLRWLACVLVPRPYVGNHTSSTRDASIATPTVGCIGIVQRATANAANRNGGNGGNGRNRRNGKLRSLCAGKDAAHGMQAGHTRKGGQQDRYKSAAWWQNRGWR